MNNKAKPSAKSILLSVFRYFGILLIALIFLTGLAWYLLQDNNPFVLRMVRQTAAEKWNANLRLNGYRLEWQNGFSDLSIKLNGLRLSNFNKTNEPLLRLTKAETIIHPWSLIFGNDSKRAIEPIQADSIWIHFIKDTADVSNFRFNNRSSKEQHSSSPFIKKMPDINVVFLDFYFENNFKEKWQRAQLSPLVIETREEEKDNWFATLKGDAYFDALVFNKKDGGFLENAQGLLELEFRDDWKQNALSLIDGFLEVDNNKYLLNGKYAKGQPDRVLLDIRTEGVLLPEVLPLLSKTINTVLKTVEVDKPIVASFSMEEFIKAKKKAVIKVDFTTSDAKLKFEQLKMSDADLHGFYSNDCNDTGEGSKEGSCVAIDQLNGEFMGLIPAELMGKITELDDPILHATGNLDINMPRLNELLSSSQKATFKGGDAVLDFYYSGRFEDIIKTPFDENKIRMNGMSQFQNVVLDIKNSQQDIPALTGQLAFDDKKTTLQDLSLEWQGTTISLTGNMNNLPEFLLYGNEAVVTDLDLHLDHLDLNKLSQSDKKTSKIKNKVGDNWAYEEWKNNLTSLASNLNGIIHLHIDKLSYDTLFFTDVATQCRLYTPRQAAYQDSSMIRIDELSAKFMGEAPVYINFSFPQDTEQEVVFDVEIPSVPLYVNTLLGKEAKITTGAMDLQMVASTPLKAMLDPKQLLSALRYEGMINFMDINANLERATWPLKRLSGTFAFDSDQLFFNDLTFNYERSPFHLNGTIADYAFFRKGMNKKATIDLQLKGSHLNRRNDQLEAATKNNDAKKSMPSPPALFRSLDTLFHYATGKIKMQVDSILTLKHTIQPLILDVKLVEDTRYNNEYQLKVDSFNFGLGDDNFVKGAATIRNPKAPELDAHFEANMTLEKLGELLPSDYMELRKGDFNMNLSYAVPLYDTLNAQNYFFKADINGEATMSNGWLFYNYRDFDFKNINGTFKFDERALYIRHLGLDINDNHLEATGESENFFPFFIDPNQRAHIVLAVDSPVFDFGNFTAPHGLGKDTIRMEESTISENPDSTINVFVKTGSFIDELLDKGSLDMTASVNELRYNKFLAEDFFGNISIHPDSVYLRKVKMEIADGQCTMDGSITNIVLHEPRMELSADMDQHNLKELFRQFGFYETMPLNADNLKGLASASLNINADVNSNYAILPETMQGDMVIKLTGAELMDVAAFERVPKFLAKKRHLDHILIDTILVKGDIIGSNLYFDEFDVQSSAFGFSIAGVYGFANTDATRILLSVPLSNLYKRYYTLEEIQEGELKRKGIKFRLEQKHKKGKRYLRLKLRGKETYKEEDENG